MSYLQPYHVRPMPRFSFLLRLPIVLALAHGYVALRLAGALSDILHPATTGLALLAIYVLIMAGFLMRRKSGRPVGDLLAWVGFLTLGLFSWLFVLTVLRDLLLLVTGAAWLVWSPTLDEDMWRAVRRMSALAVPVLSTAALLLGLLNARRRAAVRDVDITLPDLPMALQGYTVVLQPGGLAPDLACVIHDSLLNGYLDALGDATAAQGAARSIVERRHHHLISSCERLVLSGEDADVALADIAQRSGYSLRSLELIFRRSVGMTPSRWFMTARLKRRFPGRRFLPPRR